MFWPLRNKQRVIVDKYILLFVVILLSACDLSLAGDITPPPGVGQPALSEAPKKATNGPLYPLIPPDPVAGKLIYEEKCAPCHGPKGKGDGSLVDRLPKPVPAIGDESVARQSKPSDWYQIVTEGRMENQMPPFASLTDQDRWNVIAYVYTLSTSQDRLLQGEELYVTYCVSCHGEAARTSIDEVSQPGGSDRAAATKMPTVFTNPEWIAGKSTNDLFQVISIGMGESMPAFQEQLSETERWVLAEHLRSMSLNITKDVAVADSPDLPRATSVPSSGETVPGESKETLTGQEKEAPLLGRAQTGVISGTVTNLSGGQNPTGLEIILHEFEDMQLVMTRTVELEENGLFWIEDIPIIPQHSFLAITEFENVTYGSKIAVFENGQEELELPIEVYESTSDASRIVIDRLHLFLEPVGNDTLRVITLYILSNLGNKVVVPIGEIEPSVSFSIPKEASQLEFQDGQLGGRFVPTEDGFGDLAPIRPGNGSHQILLAYELPFSSKIDLPQKMSLSVKAVVVLIPEDGLRVRSDSLQDVGTRDVEGFQYRTYTGTGIDPQQTLNLSISQVSSFSLPELSRSSSGGLLIGSLALIGATIAALARLYSKVRKNNNDLEIKRQEVVVTQPESVESVMDSILALDDLYKEGQLPEDAYIKRRKDLKDRLRQLT
jgi:mono/diheme cytochrome c family protein